MHKDKVPGIILVLVLIVVVLALGFLMPEKEAEDNQPSPEVNLNNNQQESNNQDNKKSTPPSIEETRSLDGVIQSIDKENNQLVVEFNYQDQSWTSEVAISDNTFLGASNSDENKTPSELSFSDFQKSDRVIVSGKNPILKSEFIQAVGVVKMEE